MPSGDLTGVFGGERFGELGDHDVDPDAAAGRFGFETAERGWGQLERDGHGRECRADLLSATRLVGRSQADAVVVVDGGRLVLEAVEASGDSSDLVGELVVDWVGQLGEELVCEAAVDPAADGFGELAEEVGCVVADGGGVGFGECGEELGGVRVEVVGGEVLNHLLVDTAPRRPFNAPENALGDNLAALDELSDDDRAALLNHLDALVTRTRLRTLAGAG